MKKRYFFYGLIVFSIVLVSCVKNKKRRAIEGVYKGVERFVHIGPYGDTFDDESYTHQIELKLKDNGYFLLTKSTYPYSYEIPSSKLVNEDKHTKWQTFPQEIWSVRLVGDSLYGGFNEDDNYGGGDKDHYIFKGVK